MDWKPVDLSGSPWDVPGKNTGVGCHFLLRGIFLIQRLNPCLLHWAGGFFTTEPLGSWKTYRQFPKCHLKNSGMGSEIRENILLGETSYWKAVPGRTRFKTGRVEPIWGKDVYYLLTTESGFPGGSDSKESACNVDDSGLIPRLGRFPGERNGNPL